MLGCTALLLGLVVMAPPRVPTEADVDTAADASWSAVLGYAHEHGLQFGRDIVFTYGPLGFLASPFASGDQFGLRLAADAVLGLILGTALARLAWRMWSLWRWLFLLTAIFLLANISPRTDLVIELSVVCWGILAVMDEERAQIRSLAIFTVICVTAALIKITLLILAGLCLGMVALQLLVTGRRRRAVAILAIFAGGFVLGWIGSGQSILNVPTFISRALMTSSGYNQAMGYEGSLELRWRGIFVAMAALGTVFARVLGGFTQGARSLRAIWLTWCSGTLFLVWKHGFVRTDLYHAGFFFGFAPILALALEAVPWQNATGRVWGRVGGLLCAFVAVMTLQAFVVPGDLSSALWQPALSIRQNGLSLVMPERHIGIMHQALAAQQQRCFVPGFTNLHQARVDMFGCEQTSILFSGLNYHPRPVFQSYAAYSAPLMQLNADFYLSADSPEFVALRLLAMDRKFPPLEDALTFRHLLINYELAAEEGAFLVLRKRTADPARLKALAVGTVQAGQTLDLEEYGAEALWVSFDLQPSLAGRLRAFLYQPPKVRLALWYGPRAAERSRRFRAPSPMLAAGFLISPLLADSNDVLKLYAGRELTRPTRCAVEFDKDTEGCWQASIPYHVYRLENKLGVGGEPGAPAAKTTETHGDILESR